MRIDRLIAQFPCSSRSEDRWWRNASYEPIGANVSFIESFFDFLEQSSIPVLVVSFTGCVGHLPHQAYVISPVSSRDEVFRSRTFRREPISEWNAIVLLPQKVRIVRLDRSQILLHAFPVLFYGPLIAVLYPSRPGNDYSGIAPACTVSWIRR